MSKARTRKLSTTITSEPKSKRAGRKRGMTGQYRWGFSDPRKKSAVPQPKSKGKPAVTLETPMMLRDRRLLEAQNIASRANRTQTRVKLSKAGWPRL
jgi:hypothetical protein